MLRRRFLFGAAACALASRPAMSQDLDGVGISDLLDDIPGTVAVYARLMNGTPPKIAIRTDEPFASASIIKLPIMLAAYRAYENGDCTPETLVTVHKTDLIGGSDALAGTKPGTQFEMQTLVNAMIRVSDNSASNALISYFGLERINRVAHQAGMVGTSLQRRFADVIPSWRKNLNTTTAGDVGRLLYAIERGAREGLDTVATSRSCREMIGVMLGQEDKTKFVRGLPSNVAIAHKTGELTGVRHDAGIVAPYGDVPFVLTVLTKDDSDVYAADAGIGRIAGRVYKAFRAIALVSQRPKLVASPYRCIRYEGRCE